MKLIEVDVTIVEREYRRDERGRLIIPENRLARLTVVYEGGEKEILAVANDLAKEMVK